MLSIALKDLEIKGRLRGPSERRPQRISSALRTLRHQDVLRLTTWCLLSDCSWMVGKQEVGPINKGGIGSK